MLVIGRNTQGVRLMSLREDESVVDVGKISEDSASGEAGEEPDKEVGEEVEMEIE